MFRTEPATNTTLAVTHVVGSRGRMLGWVRSRPRVVRDLRSGWPWGRAETRVRERGPRPEGPGSTPERAVCLLKSHSRHVAPLPGLGPDGAEAQ